MTVTSRLAGVAIVVGSCLTAVADAPLVFCECTACEWHGGWYVYRVDSVSYPIMEFTVGTGDLARGDYNSVVTPPGWQFEVTSAVQESHACGDFAVHGTFSTGPCRSLTEGVARWWTDDPARAVEMYVFAFEHAWPAEDVGWRLMTRRPGPPEQWYEFGEFWDAEVGTGVGPLHGPYGGPHCWSNDDCRPDYYCWFHDCAAETGLCRPRPHACPYLWAPVCGCDGVTYANACTAAAAGMSLMYPWRCEAGDIDGDGDVDATDMHALFDCLAGPDAGYPLPCAEADLDVDGDVDLADARIFQIMFE